MHNLLDPELVPTRVVFDSLDPYAQAQTLSLAREMARRSFACFIRYWMLAARAPFKWNWHWAYLADIMQAVADRDRQVRFLIVNIPPRFAKSTLLSQLWQAWMIGREDSRRSSLFSTACTATLAARDSRRTLEMMKAPWYQRVFPQVQFGARKETEMEWETNAGAYRLACGAGGTVLGRGADHLLVDDLIQAEDANSEQVREKANEWLGETFRTRLDDQMTGTITIIMQRLHERDATGYLLEQMNISGADQYHHIKIPLIAPTRTVVTFNDVTYATREEGDLLHPAYIDAASAASIKIAQRHNFEGQYQQNPIKMVGGHLDPRRILRLQGSGLEIKSRLGLTPTFYIDFASTDKQINKNDPDFTCIEAWARDQLGRLIILDCWRKQTADYAVVARTLINMHRLWRPRFTKGERGGLINVFQPVLLQQMQLAGHFLNLEPLKARGNHDKMERSMTYQGMLNAGLVCAPQEAPWFDAFEAEQRAFPNGAHDDMCIDMHAKVHTIEGCKPISAITNSDYVLTRQGWKRVLWAGQTGVQPVMSLGPLTGTPSHRVWTANRGWIRMGSLLDSDVLVFVESPSPPKGEDATDTQPAEPDIRPSIGTITVAELKKRVAPCAESTCGTCGGIPLAPAVPVFNLHVAGCHEFFAEGVLVHNCDPAFDAAAEYDTLQRGEAPVVSPTDPTIILSEDVKRRLAEALEEQKNPPIDELDWS